MHVGWTEGDVQRNTSGPYGAGMRPVLVALLAGWLALAGCSDERATDAPPSSATTEVVASPRLTEYAVGRRSIELVDESRPTAADPKRGWPERPNRTLPVLVLYPATGDAPDVTDPVDDAPPADGTFPLIVFAHGWRGNGPAYEGRIREWARAGYIVAAPTFPLSSGREGVLTDYPNQPGDVSFVIDELLSLPADDPLAGHVDAERVVAAGHSLGAITTIGVSLNSCCDDERLDAAIELSGIRWPFPGGAYEDLGQVPFLAVHGAEDRTVDVDGSDSLFADAPGPAAYLRLPDGDHTSYLFTEGALIDEVVLASLDAWLFGDSTALDEAGEVVEDHGRATFEVKTDG